MSSALIVTLMQNLIGKRFYPTKQDAIDKLNVYFAVGQISDSDYTSLVLLAEQQYAEVI